MSVNLTPLKTATLEDGSVINVLRERDNKVVGRLEVEGILTHMNKGTPSRKAIKSAMAKLYNKSEELVVIKYIRSEYGMGRSKIKAHIYNDIQRLKLFEPEYLLKRDA